MEVNHNSSPKLFPVALFFTNMAGNPNPINLSVTFDDTNIVVNKDIYSGDSTKVETTSTGMVSLTLISPPQHWEYNLMLVEGTHQMVATTKNGDAGMDVVFTVDKPIWLDLTYWGKNHFQFHISEHMLIFQ
jgi:hypothetical protein